MTGPFTKPEKVVAVEPIRCRVENVRKLWEHITNYNKPLVQFSRVSADLDEDVMTALQESLVDANADIVPGDGVALQEDDRGQPSSSEGLIMDSSPVTYIGTNLLVADHTSCDNTDLDGEEESAVADESTNQPNEAGIREDDDLAALFGLDDHCDGDEGHEDEAQQATDARTAREEADFEAIVYRVRSNYLIC
jgi:hypothetical protein